MEKNKQLFLSFIVILTSMFTVNTAAASSLPDFVELVEKAQPSVVSIATTIKVPRRNLFSRSQGSSQGPSGSGFLISKDGFVVTNNHVIDGVEKVFVRLHNGKDLEAEIVGTDAETDIALLKVTGNDFKPFKIGNIDKTKVGSWALAIGAPFGFDQTVTAGIISAKGRSVGDQYIPYIQTDVAINPGNSGGPLIDMNGRVVGVNSKILSTSGGSNGLSFSIPIDLAMDVVNQIKDTGQVVRGYLGVNYQEVSYDLARSFGLDKSQGALINVVAPNSPAERSGIKTGDIVLQIDGKTIKNSTELPFIIGRYRPGQSAKLNIVRNGEKMSLTVNIGSRNGGVAEAAPSNQSNKSSFEWLGAEFKNIPEEVASRTNITHGVIVSSIDSGALYDAGIRQGDIIQSVQLKTVNDIAELESVADKLPREGSVPVLVNRPDAGSQYLILDLD
jgi:serine protease Do